MEINNEDNIADGLVNEVQKSLNFRDESSRVGAIYTMNYLSATVAIYDYDREKAGGLPKGGFLIAAESQGGNKFILLRILKEARLPNAVVNDQTRQQAIEKTGNEEPWANALDTWLANQVSLHGIECRILGTFIDQGDDKYSFAEDTDNFFAVTNLLVWKPGPETLHKIVNHRHRNNTFDVSLDRREKVAVTRFAAAEDDKATRAPFLLDPTDLLRRRTVYLGMSRSGKSNAMKITAESIYRLRQADPNVRIGQLIFDPNGEYAQDNSQDGPGLHRIHETIGLPRENEVGTYGLFQPPTDRKRTIMKINFFGDRFPAYREDKSVESALDQLMAGREIVTGIMADETSRYTTAFRDADLSIPENIRNNRGAHTRYKRCILVYQTALSAAGFTKPSWEPSIKGLFRKDFIEALSPNNNTNSKNKDSYERAYIHLSGSNDFSWDALKDVWESINLFIQDSNSGYKSFNDSYISNSSTGESWAEPRLTNLLKIFQTQNGPRSFQGVRDQHDPSKSLDYTDSVVKDLNAGKLVIVDQSTGDPVMNQRAAERIMWRVFRSQQEKFRNSAISGGNGVLSPGKGILIYLEEAHNLLPRAGSADVLRTVWARAAKEGSKMNIGMVLATQAPSSIMPEILSETDNWILAYLNSQNERKVIAGYMDFEDFLDQIGKVSEPGFVRLRTLSLAYTIPVQFERFRLDIQNQTDNSDYALS